MKNAIQLSRGDRNRNARLARLRDALPPTNAVVGIDLADRVQALVVMDHESNVIPRRRVNARPWDLDPSLTWALGRARAAGFTGVTVACEPTGHRWQVVRQLATTASMPMVCVSPMLVAHAREQEDLSPGKTDDRDATLIARLSVDRRCYLPEPADEVWGRLRQLGNRRARLVGESIACQHQLRDLLECAWPAVLEGPVEPLQAKTFRDRQGVEQVDAGVAWIESGLVFTTTLGTQIDPSTLRREFDKLTRKAGIGHWHPHELRHSAASLLSAAGVPIEQISDVLGHEGPRTTAAVYRHLVNPSVSAGKAPMDALFTVLADDDAAAGSE